MSNLVPKALEYFDNNMEELDKKFRDVKYIRWTVYPTDIKKNKVKMYNKDKERLFEFEYEILGMLNVMDDNVSVWTWAWSIPTLDKKSTQLSRKILDYGFNLEGGKNNFLKTELLTSRFRITNYIQTEIHVAIGSYLTKQSKIFRFIFPPDNEQSSANREYIPLIPIDKAGNRWEAFYLVLYEIEK